MNQYQCARNVRVKMYVNEIVQIDVWTEMEADISSILMAVNFNFGWRKILESQL